MNNKFKKKQIIIGKIGKTLGIKGWIKIFSFFKIKENIFEFKTWSVKKNNFNSIVKIEKWGKHHKKNIVKIKNINNINQAKILTNCHILVNKEEILKKNYFIINELIKYKIINTINKKKIGIIKEIIKTKINTILVIETYKNKEKKLIPFIKNKIIKKINHKEKYIEINQN